jgi:hypothetical protein
VPKGDILHSGLQVAAQHPRQASDRLGADRVALVRHSTGTFLTRLETLLDFTNLGSLQMAQFYSDHFHRRPDRGARPQVFGMTVAGDHLRCGHGRKTEPFGDKGFNEWIDVGVRTDGAAEFAHGNRCAGGPQPVTISPDLQSP